MFPKTNNRSQSKILLCSILHVLYLMLNQPFIFKGPHIINMNLHAVINYKNKLKVARVPIRTSRKVYFVAESIFINVLPNVPWFFFLKHERNVYSGDYGPVRLSIRRLWPFVIIKRVNRSKSQSGKFGNSCLYIYLWCFCLFSFEITWQEFKKDIVV